MTVYPSSNNAALAQAIADARAGRRDDAVRRLRQIVQADPANVDAWIWLGGTAPDVAEQRRALERALALAPDNERAQQGLLWLQRTAPQAFVQPAPAAPPNDGRWARAQGATPHVNTFNDVAHRAAAPTQAVDQQAARAYAPPPPRAMPFDQPTIPMPVQGGAAYQQPTSNGAPYQQPVSNGAPYQGADVAQPRVAPPLPRTELMYTPPQTYVRERAVGANIARGLLMGIWLLGTGAAIVTTAIVIYGLLRDPLTVDNMFGALIRPLGYGADLGDSGRFNMLVGSIVLLVLDVVVCAGLWMRALWAWRTGFTVALLTFFGAATLALLPFLITIPGFDGTLSNPLTQSLVGLLLFTFLLLVLTYSSRGAFTRGGHNYDVYER